MTPEYIKDKDCTKDTPVTLGKPECPIFGTGQRIKPRVGGKQEDQNLPTHQKPKAKRRTQRADTQRIRNRGRAKAIRVPLQISG